MRFFILFFICLFLYFPVVSQASDSSHEIEKKFQSLPILHEGRIKPFDSFARIYIKTFAEKNNLESQSHINWLLTSLFFPEDAIYIPVFKINNHHLFDLEENKDNLYSYDVLSIVLMNNKESLDILLNRVDEDFSPQEEELISIYQKHVLYTQILRSMTLFLPLAPEKKSVYQGGEDKRFFDVITSGGKENSFLRVISLDGQYMSPWQVYFLGAEKNLQHWQDLTIAYRKGDIAAVSNILDMLQSSDKKLFFEVLYNQLSLLRVVLILSCVSLVLVIFSFYKPKKIISGLALALLTVSGLSLALHITLRSLILERPPVGTLYESIIFVALIVICSTLIFAIKRRNLAILLGSVLSSGLLIVSGFFEKPETLGTLDAVLNTNFWLATHVVCITIGYGACLFVSALAHVMFFQKNLQKTLQLSLIISLFFTVIGTVLGGIWADQSWGRFWGWDPKENGALLIVLWIAWLLHGRMSGHLRDKVYLACCAFLSIIVVLAWFGINLLNVGLHSYGFISGVAWGIGLFCLFEILCVGALYYLSTKRRLKYEA